MAPIREIGSPIVDAVGPKPYTTFQPMFDAATGAGARNYWKADSLSEMSDEAIGVMYEHATTIDPPETTIGMTALGGEIPRRPAESTPSAQGRRMGGERPVAPARPDRGRRPRRPGA